VANEAVLNKKEIKSKKSAFKKRLSYEINFENVDEN
jgi:hypothetical protein